MVPPLRVGLEPVRYIPPPCPPAMFVLRVQLVMVGLEADRYMPAPEALVLLLMVQEVMAGFEAVRAMPPPLDAVLAVMTRSERVPPDMPTRATPPPLSLAFDPPVMVKPFRLKTVPMALTTARPLPAALRVVPAEPPTPVRVPFLKR